MFGMISGLPCASPLRGGGAVCGEPPEMTSANAIKIALTPMLATSAGTRSNATMTPLTTPEATPIMSASRTQPAVSIPEACARRQHGDNDGRQRDPPRNRQIETTLLDDDMLTDRGERQDRHEWQHG